MNMKIEHIAIWADELDALKDFYVSYFGARSSDKYENPKKGFSSYFLSFGKGGARLELMHSEDAEKGGCQTRRKGLAHFALSTGSRTEVDSLTERLLNDGHTVAGLPRVTGDGYYESVVLDPEGNTVEITE